MSRRTAATTDPAQRDLFAAPAPPPDAGPDASRLVATAAADAGRDASRLLATLADWAERGWIRRLDAALPRFLAEVAPDVGAPALLAAAITAHLEGRGHACLPIADWLAAPDRLLAWKPEPLAALGAAMAAMPADAAGWLAALGRSAVVETIGDASDAAGDGAAAAHRTGGTGGNGGIGGNGSGGSGGTGAPGERRPLLLQAGRLYLRRYWRYEGRVATQIGRRAAAVEPYDAAAAQRWLDRLFPDRLSPDRASPDRSSPDRSSPDRSSPDRASPDAARAFTGRADDEPDWQKIACAVALRGRIAVVTGGPGTGKTWTAARLLALLFALSREGVGVGGTARMRIALAAPTGKAAARLKQSIDAALAGLRAELGESLPWADLAAALGPAKTLHALLGARPGTRRFRHDAAEPLPVDLLVVDEASMVHLEMMAALLDALPPAARVVLLGDKDQLASVEAGAVLGELCRDAERVRYTAATAREIEATTGQRLPAGFIDDAGPALAQRVVMLRTSRRFGGAIDALARAVNAGDAVAAEAALGADRAGPVCRWPAATPAAVVDLAAAGRAGAPGGHRAWLEAIADRPAGAAGVEAWARRVVVAFDRFRVLCAVRDGEWGVRDLNRAIEQRLRDDGLLAAGGGEWYEGRPVLVTRNDRALGIANGDIGIALRAGAGGPLRAWFVDGDGVRSVAVGRLADVETAFAMTVHKAQGSEFAHTVLVLPAEPGGVTTRELVYTGITRAREALTLVARHDRALADALALTARRSGGLHDRLGAADTPPTTTLPSAAYTAGHDSGAAP